MRGVGIRTLHDGLKYTADRPSRKRREKKTSPKPECCREVRAMWTNHKIPVTIVVQPFILKVSPSLELARKRGLRLCVCNQQKNLAVNLPRKVTEDSLGFGG